jgi:hypothetical protein
MIKLIDLLNEISIRKKQELGSGTESTVYDFETQPDKVITSHRYPTWGNAEKSWDDRMAIMIENPDIFVKVYKYNEEKGYLVIEKVDAKRLVRENEEMNKIFEDNPEYYNNRSFFVGDTWYGDRLEDKDKTFWPIIQKSGIIDFINITRWGIMEGNDQDVKFIMSVFKKESSHLYNVYKKWIDFINLVNSKIGLGFDFSFENLGYDKQGNLKLFDF